MFLQYNLNDKLALIKKSTEEELLNGSSSFGKNIDVVIEVYRWLFDSGCSTCASKFRGYIQRIKNYTMDTKCSYKLKGDGQVTVAALGGKTMTNHNITDELAEAFISTNPSNRITFFQTFPKDWEKRAKAYGKPVKKKQATAKKAPAKKEK